jgi:hypothetical protein
MTALGLVVAEGWRFRRPRSQLFVTPVAYSLADAIERDDVHRAYEFVRAGQNPTELIAVRHSVLTGGRFVLVSPLLWAVAVNSRQTVLMLLGFGARMDRATDRRAACLAEALGHEETARLLRLYGDTPSPKPCPEERKTSDPPLLAFLADSG